MGVGSPVKELLVEKDMTQEELANAIKISRTHVSAVINSSRSSQRVRLKIARYFKRPYNDLWPNAS